MIRFFNGLPMLLMPLAVLAQEPNDGSESLTEERKVEPTATAALENCEADVDQSCGDVAPEESGKFVSVLRDSVFQLRVGAFFADLDSSISIDSRLGRIGDGLNFERDLGMPDTQTTLYGGASWRFAEKHVLEWEFFDLGRDGLTKVEKSWDIGDSTILANGQIASSFNVRINRFTYKYRFFENSKTSMDFMAGLHGMRLNADLALSGDLIVDGEPVYVLPNDANVEVENTTLPLPHFGLGISHAFTPRLMSYAMLKGFALEIGDTYGRLVEANVGVQYQLGESFGIGAGIKWFFLDVVEDETPLVDVDVDFDFFGPAVFMTYRF